MVPPIQGGATGGTVYKWALLDCSVGERLVESGGCGLFGLFSVYFQFIFSLCSVYFPDFLKVLKGFFFFFVNKGHQTQMTIYHGEPAKPSNQ